MNLRAFFPTYLVALTMAFSGPVAAQHVPHARADAWQPHIEVKTWSGDQGPRVVVDAAHGNWHTIQGRFRPFADLLKADGYRVQSASEPVTTDLLDLADVFVVANAVLGGEDSEWVLPTPLAFSDPEVAIIRDWIEQGGALLLIADHMPFPGSVENLARALGLAFYNGFAKKSVTESGTLVYTRSNGLLADHKIIHGVSVDQQISSVKAYTGQGFRATTEVEPLLRLPDNWSIYFPHTAWEIDGATPRVTSAGLLQGAVFRHGRGRVAVFGEAAMFTAQSHQVDDGTIRVGFGDPEAPQNPQFVLNVMHWLSESGSSER